MTDEIKENTLRDIYAVSNFGDLEAITINYHASKSSKPAPARRSTPKRSHWRTKNHVTIGPDDHRPTLMGHGRGSALTQLKGSLNEYDVPRELSQGLLEIGSANYRNEMIESHIEDEQLKRKYEDCCSSDMDEDEGPVDAVRDVEATSPSSELPSPSPAKISSPAAKVNKPKKRRNVVLRSYLAKKTAEDDGGSVKSAVTSESVAKATAELAVDENDNSDVYVLNGDLAVLELGDNDASSEIEVESQESYLMDDGRTDRSQTSDDLQVSVEALTGPSTRSSSSKSHGRSQKSRGRSSSSGKSSYHGTSHRKRMVPMSPVPLQNPTLGRRSPLGNVYVPKIVDTKFSYTKRDFPPL